MTILANINRKSTPIGIGAFFLLTVVTASCSADGQTPTDSETYPDARGYAQLISHPPSGTVILFGGESNRRFSFEAIWSYDPAEDTWKRFDTPVHPVAVGGTAAAYDAESDRIVFVFSTRLDSSAPRGYVRLSETWAFDVSSGQWTKMNPDPAPFGLMGARMSYDSESDRIILFGGADFTSDPAEWFNTTWSYDFNSNSWTEMPNGGNPPGRSYFGMAYDENADRVLAFGGSPDGVAASMWSYDYNENNWESIEYSGDAQPDHHPFMMYSPDMDRMLYVVGESFSAFDYNTRSWTSLPWSPDLGTRYFTALAPAPGTGNVVLFGGGPRGMQYNNDTWVYNAESGWERRGSGDR